MMPSSIHGQKPPRFGKMRNVAQLISGALLVSLLVLSGVVWFVMDQVPESKTPIASDLLYLTGAVLSVACAVAGLFLPRLMVARLPKQHLALRLSGYTFGRIVFSACFEAAALFWAVLALILKQPICLAGPLAAAVVMASQFPTQGRMEEAVEMTEEAFDRAVGHAD